MVGEEGKRVRVWASLLVGVVLLASGCRQQTVIRTEPEGARVWVDQVRVEGTAPATYQSRCGFPGTARIKVAKEGYEPVRDWPMEKSYHADITLLWLIPGVIPYFFTARFEDELSIPMKKKGS